MKKKKKTLILPLPKFIMAELKEVLIPEYAGLLI